MNANPCEPPLFARPLSLSRADFLAELGWLSTPREVANALDSANDIGPSVVHSLMLGDTQAPEHTAH